MEHCENLFWTVTDVRLAPNVTPHQFAFTNAEDYWSVYEPESDAELQFVRNKLHNCAEQEGKIHYCTFSGIVCGRPYIPDFNRGFDQGGYFTYSEGMTKLQEIKREWLDHDNINTKLPNPKLQPSVTSLTFDYRSSKRGW
jgi:hypothetical protein